MTIEVDSIPVSAVVATRDRASSLSRVLDSLLSERILPVELIVVDGSAQSHTRELLASWGARVAPKCIVKWHAALRLGAAIQRNQGVVAATQPFVWFFDDDIVFEPQCVHRLWAALQSDANLGGVNAMIINQCYQPPGLVSRLLFTLMHGQREKSFAGRVIGPAINLLPEDRDDLPEVVPVEWLNTTCTLYRHEALPDPPFSGYFTGYSLMEDVTLSLMVGRRWTLANARTARVYHDSQPGAHKSDIAAVARMQLLNRHYVMREILNRRGISVYARLVVWEIFGIVFSALSREGLKTLPKSLAGKMSGAFTIARELLC